MQVKIATATVDVKGAVLVFSTLDERHNVGCSIPVGLPVSGIAQRVKDSLDVLTKAVDG